MKNATLPWLPFIFASDGSRRQYGDDVLYVCVCEYTFMKAGTKIHIPYKHTWRFINMGVNTKIQMGVCMCICLAKKVRFVTINIHFHCHAIWSAWLENKYSYTLPINDKGSYTQCTKPLKGGEIENKSRVKKENTKKKRKTEYPCIHNNWQLLL